MVVVVVSAFDSVDCHRCRNRGGSCEDMDGRGWGLEGRRKDGNGDIDREEGVWVLRPRACRNSCLRIMFVAVGDVCVMATGRMRSSTFLSSQFRPEASPSSAQLPCLCVAHPSPTVLLSLHAREVIL